MTPSAMVVSPIHWLRSAGSVIAAQTASIEWGRRRSKRRVARSPCTVSLPSWHVISRPCPGGDPALGVRADLDEADLAQHPEVTRHRRLGQIRQGGDQFTGGALAATQSVEQGAPTGFGDGLEHIHASNIALRVYRRNTIFQLADGTAIAPAATCPDRSSRRVCAAAKPSAYSVRTCL